MILEDVSVDTKVELALITRKLSIVFNTRGYLKHFSYLYFFLLFRILYNWLTPMV